MLRFNNFFVVENNFNQNVIYTNISSLRQHFDSLLLVLNLIKYKISIIILSGIWIGNDETVVTITSEQLGLYVIFNGITVYNLNMNFVTADTLLLIIKYSMRYFKIFLHL